MEKLYKAMPVTQKPENGTYFCITSNGGSTQYVSAFFESGAWMRTDMPITHYLVPLTPIQGLTDEEIDKIAVDKVSLLYKGTNSDDLNLELERSRLSLGMKIARDHYNTLLQSERDKQGEFADNYHRWMRKEGWKHIYETLDNWSRNVNGEWQYKTTAELLTEYKASL